MENGLRPGSYLGREDIVDYYAETVSDDGDVPVILEIDAACLTGLSLEPDYPGIEEPLSYTLGMSEDAILDRWQKLPDTWQASLELIGSFRCLDTIPPEALSFPYSEDPDPL
jgi:hypothetical protein